MLTLALGRTIWTLVGKVRKYRLRIWKRKRGEEGRKCESKCEGACRLGNQQKRISHVKEKQLRILLLTIRHSWQTLSLEESPQTPLHASLISTESLSQRIPQTCQSTLKSFSLISLQNSGDLTPPQAGNTMEREIENYLSGVTEMSKVPRHHWWSVPPLPLPSLTS